MEKVISSDGTPIAFYCGGTGSPLVLVSGTGAANAVAWAAFPALEDHFTVYAMDRRGRGESGDGPAYAIDREFEDIAAVVNSIGEPVFLLGHSFGALCSLESALLTRNLRKLILYEPWIPRPGILMYPEEYINRLEELLAAGHPEEVILTHYRENVGMPSEEIEQIKLSPAWPARLATAHTLPREMRAEEQYRFDAQRFKDLRTPTLLLLGGESPDFARENTQLLNATLPNSLIIELPGQQHIAMYTAPELFVHEILRFLEE